MAYLKGALWGLLSQALILVSALPVNHTDDRVGAAIDAGTFQDPSVQVRPRFRYWIPDASVDLDRMVDDVREIGRVGASGLELLGFYLYGGPPAGFGTFAPVDWSVYGWGTDAWRNLFKTFATATKENGLIFDFAMGPSQGQGVPAKYDDDGKAWDLSVIQTTFTAGEHFEGTLPGWGTGPLEAVTLAGSPASKTVAVSTLADLTSQVGPDGQLNITIPSNSSLSYILFSVYLVHSEYQAQDSPLFMQGPQTPPETWLQNGSWATDHFSARGAQMATDFWDQFMLVDGVLELVQEVGNYAWEDSVELQQKYRWTKGFLQQFEDQHHYQLQRFLPVIFGFKTDQPDAGERYTMNYRDTLAVGYNEFLKALTAWANGLGIQYSCQIEYGMSQDELESIPYVNAAEDESLEFANEIDRYRQFAGPANLAGKRIISNELGAQIYRGFQQTLPELIDLFKHAVAGGVNQVVIHGSPFSGNYPNTTWPGVVTFGYEFSEAHNRHQPAWEDYKLTLDYMARHQFIFQTGIPRRDVVFWEKRWWFPGNTSYGLSDLLEEGYTYEYISPNNFNLPAAVVEDDVFAPSAQAFKVLVVRILDYLTLPGVQQLAEYARAGLPIIFDGGVPTRMWSYNKCEAQKVSRIMNDLASLDNVHVITDPDRNLADILGSIGIQPRARISSNGTWYTVWREDTANDVDYVFVYNSDGNATAGTVEFATTKTPYWFDAWTGEQTPVTVYEQTSSSTIIPFRFFGNQSSIVAFLPEPLGPLPELHVTSTSDGILSVTPSDKSLSIKVGSTGGASPQVTTSDGNLHSLAGTAAVPFELASWVLTAEHWDPPADLSDADTAAVKSNTTHVLPSLVSWQEIDGLQNASGRGYYATTFDWPPAEGADGAIIDFHRVFHTLKVYINGKQIPPLDVFGATADVGSYLQSGQNVVEAVVATTLGNVLRPIYPELRFSATTALKKIPPPQDYGLRGPVVVIPYKETII